MRWLFLFVLIVNLSYVAWEYSHPDDVVAPGASKNVPPILLLSERRQADAPPEQVAAVRDESAEMPPPEVEAEVDYEALAETEQKTVEPETSLPGLAAPVALVDTPVAETDVEACYTLGPFRELEKLRAFTRAIKDYVLDASFRSRDEQEQSMFWVYLPPRDDFSKAKALGTRLEKMKIRDYYIINKGDQKYGVSLGHFREKDRAYSYSDSIKQLGFKPVVEPVFRTYTIYWLDYTVLAGKNIPENIFTEQLGSNVNRLDRPCS